MARRRGGRRDRNKEQFWHRLVRLWRRSGLTVRDFCGEHAVSEPSFYSWRRTLAERCRQRDGRRGRSSSTANGDGNAPARDTDASGQDDQPVFVPLRVVATAADRPGPTFEVVLRGGRVVRVQAGFDAASLRELLAVLEEDRPC